MYINFNLICINFLLQNWLFNKLQAYVLMMYEKTNINKVIYNDLHWKPRLTEDIRPEEAKGFLKNSSSDNMGESIISTSSVIWTDTNYNDNIKQFQ